MKSRTSATSKRLLTRPKFPKRLLKFPKRCGCGLTWPALEWLQLEFVGVMDEGDDRIELRHCTCGSTIAMLAAVVAKAANER